MPRNRDGSSLGTERVERPLIGASREDQVEKRRTRPLKVGAFIPIVERQMDGGSARGKDILAMARTAEAVGFDSVWIPDHLLFRFEGEEPQGVWECTSLLGWPLSST